MSFKLLEIGRDALRRARIGRSALVAAAVCVATAPSPSYADKTISENTTLTEDTDWSDEGTVTIAEGVTLDLNGYILTVAGIAGAGSIVDSWTGSDAYQRLDYIQATGTQYIDTGYVHDDSTKVDMRISFDETPGADWQNFYGARYYKNDDARRFDVFLSNSQNSPCRFGPELGKKRDGFINHEVLNSTIYAIHLEKTGGESTATPEGGATVSLGTGTATGGSFDEGRSDYLFALHQYYDEHDPKWYAHFHTKAKLYSCRIYSGETLERNFVPVRRKSDGALGLFDRANNVFYGNAGTGEFNPGAIGGVRLALSGIGVASDFSGLTVGEGVTLAFVGEGALAANLDVTKFASVEVSSGAVLDLAGHNLTVNAVTGAGLITDTVGTALSGYDRLDYIQATGTQYIDTGYRHDDTTIVDMRISFDVVVVSAWQAFYGARIDNSGTTRFGIFLHNKYPWFGPQLGADRVDITTYTVTADTIYDIHLAKKDKECTATQEGGVVVSLGTGTATSDSSDGSLTGNDYLLAMNRYYSSAWHAGFHTQAKLYSCKIYSGETLERDFVPVRRKSDNVLGLLDLANGGFYANAGTGTFNAGAVVETTTGGELHIVVVEGNTASLGDMAKIAGTVKVVKTGAGELALPASGHGFAGGMEVAGGTLTMTQTPVNLLKTPITASAGGTIAVAASNGAIYTNDFTLAGGTLKVLASGSGATTTAAIDGTLALELGANDAQPAVSIDTTDCTSPTFQLTTTALTVGTGVTAAPGFVTISDAAFEARIEGGTSIVAEKLSAPVTAVWTGLGEVGNFDDPDNWSCSNKNGVALSDALPNNQTLVFRLATDADWTAKGAIALGSGVTLDLAGQNLTVSSITGAGTVTDTVGTALSGYDRLDYIQATGTQYIDTGYRHDDTTIVDMRISFDVVVVSAWQAFYGARIDNSGTTRFGIFLHNKYPWFGPQLGADRVDITTYTVTADTIYDIHLAKKGEESTVSTNGVIAVSLGTGTETGSGNGSLSGNDYLLAMNRYYGNAWHAGFHTQAKLYSCKIYSGTLLKRDFVPVRRKSDNVLGLLDLANGGFYANAGTGTFNAGAVVETTPGGELHITVAEGDTLSLDSLAKISGSVKVVKDGAGTLVAPATGQVFFGGIEVEEGTLSVDGALAYGGEIDAASGTTVSVPASVGSAGTSVVNIAGGTLEVANCGTSVVTGTVTLGGNAISVAGSFAPVSGTAAHTITLADGATLDFTQWAGTFPVAYPTFAYASGANITLKLEPATAALTALARSRDAETGRRNGYLLSWDAIPAGVTFSPDAATRARFRVVPDENGLRMSFKAGFSIIIM